MEWTGEQFVVLYLNVNCINWCGNYSDQGSYACKRDQERIQRGAIVLDALAIAVGIIIQSELPKSPSEGRFCINTSGLHGLGKYWDPLNRSCDHRVKIHFTA